MGEWPCSPWCRADNGRRARGLSRTGRDDFKGGEEAAGGGRAKGTGYLEDFIFVFRGIHPFVSGEIGRAHV